MTTKPRTVVLMFKPRFAAPIREGRKAQTVRRARNRPVRPGDLLSLREWSGSPYRSPQAEIVPPVVCTSAAPIRVAVNVWWNVVDIVIGGERLTHDEVCAFVRADGFNCVSDFAGYYGAENTLSFEGVLIQWKGNADA